MSRPSWSQLLGLQPSRSDLRARIAANRPQPAILSPGPGPRPADVLLDNSPHAQIRRTLSDPTSAFEHFLDIGVGLAGGALGAGGIVGRAKPKAPLADVIETLPLRGESNPGLRTGELPPWVAQPRLDRDVRSIHDLPYRNSAAVSDFLTRLRAGEFNNLFDASELAAIEAQARPAVRPAPASVPTLPTAGDARTPFAPWAETGSDRARGWGAELGAAYETFRSRTGEELPTTAAIQATRENPALSGTFATSKAGKRYPTHRLPIASQSHTDALGTYHTPKPYKVGGSSYVDAELYSDHLLEGKKLLDLEQPLPAALPRDPSIQRELHDLAMNKRALVARFLRQHGIPSDRPNQYGAQNRFSSSGDGSTADRVLGALVAGQLYPDIPARVQIGLLNMANPSLLRGNALVHEGGYHAGIGDASHYTLPKAPGSVQPSHTARRYLRFFDPPAPPPQKQPLSRAGTNLFPAKDAPQGAPSWLPAEEHARLLRGEAPEDIVERLITKRFGTTRPKLPNAGMPWDNDKSDHNDAVTQAFDVGTHELYMYLNRIGKHRDNRGF